MTQEEKVRQVFVEAMGADVCEGCSLTELATILVSQRDNAQNEKALFNARQAGKAAQIAALDASVAQLLSELFAEKAARHAAMKSMSQGVEFDEEAKVKYSILLRRAEKAERNLVGAQARQEMAASSLQPRVGIWLRECFGDEIAKNKVERNHRFLEEALELVQACGGSSDDAHNLVNYVYNRDVGDKLQEVGGALLTLAALCLAQDIDMNEAGEKELARAWTKIDIIRKKQAAKPKNSPLPQ